jgi:hypothetical protein
MKKQYDLLWKIILEPFFYDFLKFVDPKFAGTINDSKNPSFLDKELIRQIPNAEGDLEHRIVDKLVKLYTKSGTEEWILLHLEIQHQYSKDFNERMYQYFHSIYVKFKRPITAYAIITEPSRTKRNNAFKINYGGTTLEYKFNIYKLAMQDDHALMKHPNPFALVVLIAKQINFKDIKDTHLSDEKLLANKLEIAKLIFDRKLPIHQENHLMYFLIYYVNFESKETYATFERGIMLLTNKTVEDMTMQEAILEETKFEGLREGLRKGIKEGKEEEKIEIVTRMLEMQIGSDEQIVQVAKVPLSLVRRLRKKVVKKIKV